MDSAFGVRQVGIAAAAPRADLPTERQTARTWLTADRTVTAASAAPDVRLDLSPAGSAMRAAEDHVRKMTLIDPLTRQLVFRATDQRTGRVIQQLPDEALLRLRAYARSQMAAQDKAGEGRKVERIA